MRWRGRAAAARGAVVMRRAGSDRPLTRRPQPHPTPPPQAECERLKQVAAKKVRPLVWLLKKVGGKGGKKMASQLAVGMKSFITLNTKKYDLHLFFGTATLLRLEVREPDSNGWVDGSWGGSGLQA
jgi:hypothetical protein